jgi:hypothetical protein
MVNIVQEENQRLKAELSALRRVIMQVEPVVMLDGRFEEMITSPIAVIEIACQIIAQIPHTQRPPNSHRSSQIFSQI